MALQGDDSSCHSNPAQINPHLFYPVHFLVAAQIRPTHCALKNLQPFTNPSTRKGRTATKPSAISLNRASGLWLLQTIIDLTTTRETAHAHLAVAHVAPGAVVVPILAAVREVVVTIIVEANVDHEVP